MDDVRVSRRGVYYDLTISPYEYKTPYGDLFKFSSKKKLDMYVRDVDKELKRVDDLFDRHDLRGFLPQEIIDLVKRQMTIVFYHKIER